MKLLFLFTIVACLQATATGYGQTVSLSLRNAPLEKAFKEIKRQTGYHFIYTRNQLHHTKLLTIDVKDGPLLQVLEKCFRNQPIWFIVEDKYIVIQNGIFKTSPHSQSDSLFFSGQITDENGNPIPGATIKSKTTGKTTSTNDAGEFKLKSINKQDYLIITCVGYTGAEVAVNANTQISIELKIAIGTLDESIVIAYGKTTKRYATGNVSSIKSEDIIRQPIIDPINILGGKVAGLQIMQNSGVPGAVLTVRLRGQNSIANGNDPMYIVDGIPFPSSTLSGSLGGGAGVTSSPFTSLNPSDIESIEILKDADATAIYGSRGANGVILVTTKKGKQGKLNANVRFSSGLGKIPQKLKLLNTEEYILMRKEAFKNDGRTPTIANAKDLLLWDTTRYTDWQSELIGRTSEITDINASISQGNSQTSFYISTGYRKETTVYPGNFGFDRLSGNLSFSHSDLKNKFNLRINTTYSLTNKTLPRQDFTRQITLAPNAPKIYMEDGSLNWENSSWTNPLAMTKQKFNGKTSNSITNLNVSYKLLKGVLLSLNSGLTSINIVDNLIIPSTGFNPAYNVSGTAGFGNKQVKTLIVEPQLTYEKNINKSELTVLIGATAQTSHQKGLYQTGLGYTNDDLLYSLKAASSIKINNETDINYRYAGIFSRINYNINKKYLSTVTVRRDGSSRYGEENRFSNFGSLGLAWIFSKESFLSKFKALSFGKIKASAGLTGNDQIGDYKYLNLYAPLPFTYQGFATFYPTQLHNPNYSWEKVTKTELGIETGFYNDNLLINISYYRNRTSNQLLQYDLPIITGFNSILKNIPAKIQNKGVEIEVSGRLLTNRKIKWNSTFNLTIPKNKLVSFEGLENSTYSNQYVIGRSLGILKVYKHLGVDPEQGNYMFVDYDKDGRISAPNDQQNIVQTDQTWYGGWQNSINYKNLSLVFLLQFVKQPRVKSYLFRFSKPGMSTNQPTLVLNRWQQPGDISEIQKFSNSNTNSSRAFSTYRQSDAAYSKGSFCRLKNIQLNYTISPKTKKGVKIADIQIYIQAQNLFTITNYIGLDPETDSLLPPMKSILAGINIQL